MEPTSTSSGTETSQAATVFLRGETHGSSPRVASTWPLSNARKKYVFLKKGIWSSARVKIIINSLI